jgi:hypothetical protein
MMKIRSIAIVLSVVAVLSLSVVNVAQAGNLKVGAARVDISSAGYADGQPPARNFAHEYVYVRAIVLDNGETKAVLVGADLAGVRPDDMYLQAAASIAGELGIPLANIIMSPSHTHSTYPVLENTDQVLAAILQAVRLAAADMQPASIGFGEGEVFLNVNRDVIDDRSGRWTQDSNLDYPSDKTLAVIGFYNAQGEPIAGYMNYAMHPVSGFQSGIISSDFAGAATRHVEQAFGDNMIMIFTQGASGDQNPLHLRAGTNVMANATGMEISGFEIAREDAEGALRGREERLPNDPEADSTLMRWMGAQGQVVGEEAIRVMTHMERLSDNARIGASQMILTCPGRDLVERVDRGYPGTYVDGDDAQIRLGFLGINEIGLAWINAEIYSQIAQQAMAESPLAKVMVVTKSNGQPNSGYVPTDDAYGRNTFQVVRSRLKPGCAQTGIVKSFTDMAYDYIN